MADAQLVFPALGGLFAALSPWVEALLRMITGLILVPHGLRAGFGFFPDTGMPIDSPRKLGASLAAAGYRPVSTAGPAWSGSCSRFRPGNTWTKFSAPALWSR